MRTIESTSEAEALACAEQIAAAFDCTMTAPAQDGPVSGVETRATALADVTPQVDVASAPEPSFTPPPVHRTERVGPTGGLPLYEARSERPSSNFLLLAKAPQPLMAQHHAHPLREWEQIEDRGRFALRPLQPQALRELRRPDREARLALLVGCCALFAAAATGAFILMMLLFDEPGGDTTVAAPRDAQPSSAVLRFASTSAAQLEDASRPPATKTPPAAGAAAAVGAGHSGIGVANASPAVGHPGNGASAVDQRLGPVAAASASPTQPQSDTAPAPATKPAAYPAPSARTLAPDEIEALIRRGESFIRQGDISAARGVFERAAKAGDARAALALGATYDPNELRSMGAIGITPDVARARLWYTKSAEYGSSEAPKRMAMLPHQ